MSTPLGYLSSTERFRTCPVLRPSAYVSASLVIVMNTAVVLIRSAHLPDLPMEFPLCLRFRRAERVLIFTFQHIMPSSVLQLGYDADLITSQLTVG